MSRTKLLNGVGILVAGVLLASWIVGVVWPGGSDAPAAAHQPGTGTSTADAPATISPLPPHNRRHARRGASDDIAAGDATSSAPSARGGAEAPAHQSSTAPTKHSATSSGGGHASPSHASSPSSPQQSQPSSSPSPTSGGNLLTALLGGLVPHH